MVQSWEQYPKPSTEPPNAGLTAHTAVYAVDTTHPGLWTLPLDGTIVLVTLLPSSFLYISFSAQQPEWSLKSTNRIMSLLLWLLVTCGWLGVGTDPFTLSSLCPMDTSCSHLSAFVFVSVPSAWDSLPQDGQFLPITLGSAQMSFSQKKSLFWPPNP